MVYDPTLFNTDPYYDDFNSDKGFLRLLFRPGFAVQARELTQIQTLLQNQVQRFGNHIFADGSIVAGGEITENILKAVRFASLSGASYSEIIGSNLSLGATSIGNVIFAEGGISGSSVDTLNVAYVHYTSGLTFTNNAIISGTASGNPFTFKVTSLTAVPGSYISDAKLISVANGIRYVDGFFVGYTGQNIGLYNLNGSDGSQYRNFTDPTVRVGFTVNRSFINSDLDETLLDPAYGSYNYGAPGSDRYKISLDIKQYDFTPTNTSATDNLSRVDFVEFMRVVDGTTIKLEKYPDYSALEDTLARRTYDESGNYTVKPFDLEIQDITADTSTLNLKLEAGKAYIFGYEFETQGSTNLVVSKARTNRIITNEYFDRSVGPYLTMQFNSTAGNFGLTFDTNNGQNFLMSSGTGNAEFSHIGTAKIRQISLKDVIDSSYYLHLYDINLTGSYSISSFKRLYAYGRTANNDYLFTVPNGATASIENGNFNNLIYDLNNLAVEDFENSGTDPEIYYNVNKQITFNASGHASVTLSPYDAFGSIDISPGNFPQSSLMVYSANGVSLTGTVTVTGAPQYLALVLNISGPTHCYASYETKAASRTLHRTKDIVTEVITITGPSATILTDENNNSYILLKKLVDVVQIHDITGHIGAGITTNMFSSFDLDTGQTDNYYDWAKIILKPNINYSSYTGPYDIHLTRYDHSGFGAINVNSYLNGGNDPYDGRTKYEWIPTYTSKSNGYTYNLGDVYDFRPYRDLTGALTGCDVPSDNINSNVSYSHYLPRTDKIVLTRDKKFKVISGSPSVDPKAPADATDSMTLYSVTYNPYTYDSKDLSIRYVENRRYTMRDIGKIEKRVDNLEFYTSLSVVEQEAKNTEIYDTDGFSRPKLGILVDTFKGHSKGDVQDEYYKCAIDFENSELRPSFRTIVQPYSGLTAVSAGITLTSDNIAIANYTSTPAIFQTVVTNAIKINDTGIYSYLGSIKNSPSSDLWYDENRDVLTKINVQGENDAWESSATGHGFGSQWNDWELNWAGKEIVEDQISRQNQYIVSRSTNLYSNPASSNLSNRSTPENITKNTLNRYVNESISPFILSQNITINAEGLKPNTQHYMFFDGVRVDQYVTGSLISDSSGKITGVVFAVPSGTFRVGQRLIRITDSASNSLASSYSAADSVFNVRGYIQSRENGIISVRPAIIKRSSTQTEEIVNNILTRNTPNSVGQYDSLAQTFIVNNSEYPDGMFINKVGLLFSTKETTSNEPVCLQIRPMSNGYPHPSKVLPFAEKYLYPSDISASTTGSQITNFTFSTPVYVAPGEYAIVLKTNSENYTVNTAKIGNYSTVDTTQRASNNALMGSLFRPQNGGLYTADYTEDVCFIISRCAFDTINSRNFQITLDDTYDSTVDYDSNVDLIRIVSEELVPTNTSSIYGNAGLAGLDGNEYPVNKNLPSESVYTINAGTNPTNGKVQVTYISSGVVSPMIDLERFAVYYVSNNINNNRNNSDTLELNPTPYGATDPTLSRYITKSVELDDSVEALGLYVYLNAYKPYQGSLKVYMRSLPYGVQSGIEDEEWLELSYVSGRNSVNVNDYVDLQYKLDPEISRYGIFQVKIVFASSDTTNCPRIRNMRAIVV
jgi:hypothetical protein